MTTNQTLWLDQDGLRVGGTQLWTGGGVGIGTNSITGSLTVGGNATLSTATVQGQLQPANLLSQGSTTGFWLNGSTGRRQFNVQGFTFNQDGDVLTPTNKTRLPFSFTGADQTFTVPDGVSFIYAKLWGAGGGQGRAGGWSYGADGGGGGHTRALIPVTPGQILLIVVGSGGTTVNGTTQAYGGGGTNANASDNTYSGHGGGYCGIFQPGIVQAYALAIAGGGGGGGSSRLWIGNFGGAGGGMSGQTGASPYDGKYTAGGGAGTQSSGGSGGANIPSTGNNPGSAGSALQGGAGAANSYGGGGGGGYWGGGGGGYSETNTMAGGGGGSGFVSPAVLMGQTYSGAYRTPAFYWDPDLPTRAASGYENPAYGAQNTQNINGTGIVTGGHAYCVIYY